jgi:hypothetical protein
MTQGCQLIQTYVAEFQELAVYIDPLLPTKHFIRQLLKGTSIEVRMK